VAFQQEQEHEQHALMDASNGHRVQSFFSSISTICRTMAVLHSHTTPTITKSSSSIAHPQVRASTKKRA
jgi:hypothetical protein